MRRILLIAFFVSTLLVGSGVTPAAASDQAADRACVGQLTSEMARTDALHSLGRTFVRDAAQKPGFGELQSSAASSCDPALLRLRYPF